MNEQFYLHFTARWKDGTIQLPPGLFRGGRHDNGVIYICRANHEGDTVPGSYIIDENQQGRCYISYELSVYQKPEFEVDTFRLNTSLNLY